MPWDDIINTGFVTFAAFIVLSPLLVFLRRGRRVVRMLVLLVSLVLFGFLQWACPRPEGTLDFILLGPWDLAEKLPHIVKLGLVIAVTVIFGRTYCGYICPKGAIQELLHRPGLAVTVPARADRWLRYLKHVMLVAAILVPLVLGVKFMKHVGPFRVIFNLEGPTYLVAFLGVVLLASIFIGRPYCRYVCWVGSLLGLVQRLASFLKVRISTDAGCTSCQRAQKACPTEAIVCASAKTGCSLNIHDMECVLCVECLTVCRSDCLQYGGKGHPRRKETAS